MKIRLQTDRSVFFLASASLLALVGLGAAAAVCAQTPLPRSCAIVQAPMAVHGPENMDTIDCRRMMFGPA